MSARKSQLKSMIFVVCAFALLSFTLPLPAQEKGNAKTKTSDGELSLEAKTDKGSLSLGANKSVSAKDVGLAVYPGARPHKDDDKDDAAAQLWAWVNNSGFKLVVLKFESNDSPDKISTFYRKELAKYGEVLDCSAAAAKTTEGSKKSSNKLTCDDDEVQMKSGHMQFRAGTKQEQHLVGIEPNGSGSIFHLLYVKSRGSDDN